MTDDGGAPATGAAATGAAVLGAGAVAAVACRELSKLAGLKGGLIKARDVGADELSALTAAAACAALASGAASAAVTGQIGVEVGLLNDHAVAQREDEGEGGAARLTALPWRPAAAAEAA